MVGDGAISVDLSNFCSHGAFARASDSIEAVADRFKTPVLIPFQERRWVSLVTNGAYRPDKFFLAYAIDPQAAPIVREFQLDEFHNGVLEATIDSDCKTLIIANND